MTEKLKTFNVKTKIVNGKKVPIVEVHVEKIKREDGSEHVVIHAPSLSLLNKQIENKEE